MQNSVNQNNSWCFDSSWAQPLTIIASNLLIVLTIFGFGITLHTSMRHDISVYMTQTNAQIAAIQQEMKEFHGRVCIIEEKNRGR
jgi:hypothetical protein